MYNQNTHRFFWPTRLCKISNLKDLLLSKTFQMFPKLTGDHKNEGWSNKNTLNSTKVVVTIRLSSLNRPPPSRIFVSWKDDKDFNRLLIDVGSILTRKEIGNSPLIIILKFATPIGRFHCQKVMFHAEIENNKTHDTDKTLLPQLCL